MERLEPTTLTLLEQTLTALEEGRVPSSDKNEEIELAGLYLAAAETEIRDKDSAGAPVSDTERASVKAARERIEALKAPHEIGT